MYNIVHKFNINYCSRIKRHHDRMIYRGEMPTKTDVFIV